VVGICTNKQSYKFLFYGLDPKQLAWVKTQRIREGNLIAHTSVVGSNTSTGLFEMVAISMKV
jgi:hypothetical protein